MHSTSTQQQFAVLQEVHEILTQHDILYWLVGGWSVDFLLGRETREHEDLDFSIWLSDAQRMVSLLEAEGYRSDEVDYPNEKVSFTKDGVEMSFFFLVQRDDGYIVNPGRFEDWPWPEDSFNEQRFASLNGVSVRVISAEGQLDAKEGSAEHESGGPPRRKDEHDIALLRTLVAGQRR